MSAGTHSAHAVVIKQETPDQPEVLAFVARKSDGTAVGCGAVVKAGEGTAEIKRMWVDPRARGLGLGSGILAAPKAAARDDGITALRLETAIHQPEAIGLYRRAGFVEIPPFADVAAPHLFSQPPDEVPLRLT